MPLSVCVGCQDSRIRCVPLAALIGAALGDAGAEGDGSAQKGTQTTGTLTTHATAAAAAALGGAPGGQPLVCSRCACELGSQERGCAGGTCTLPARATDMGSHTKPAEPDLGARDAGAPAAAAAVAREASLDALATCWVGGHRGYVLSLADCGGRWLCSGGGDGALCFWRFARAHTERALGSPPLVDDKSAALPQSECNGGDWSADAAMGAVVELVLECTRPRAHSGSVLCMAYDSETRWLFTGGADGIVRAWGCEVPPGEAPRALRTLRGHASAVCAVACEPGGRLISADARGTILVWHWKKTRFRRAQRLTTAEHAQLAQSPDVKVASHDAAEKAWHGAAMAANVATEGPAPRGTASSGAQARCGLPPHARRGSKEPPPLIVQRPGINAIVTLPLQLAVQGAGARADYAPAWSCAVALCCGGVLVLGDTDGVV